MHLDYGAYVNHSCAVYCDWIAFDKYSCAMHWKLNAYYKRCCAKYLDCVSMLIMVVQCTVVVPCIGI